MNSEWIKYAEQVQQSIFTVLAEVNETCKTKSPEELTDIGWILKKMYENLDDTRKEVDKLKRFVETLACVKATQEDKSKIQGTLATGTPDVKVAAAIPHPKNQPEAFYALCNFFNLPEEAIQNDIVRIHYPGLETWLTKRLEQAKPLPPGIDTGKTYTTLYLKYRGRSK